MRSTILFLRGISMPLQTPGKPSRMIASYIDSALGSSTSFAIRQETAKSLGVEIDNLLTFRQLLVEVLMHAIFYGEVKFPNGATLKAESFKEWADFTRSIINHVEGPVPQQVKMDTTNVNVDINLDEWRQQQAKQVEQSQDAMYVFGEVIDLPSVVPGKPRTPIASLVKRSEDDGKD